MRYRTLTPTGDYSFGAGGAQFLVDSPDAVAQAVETRLQLATGDWFLDVTEGTPYATDILGAGTATRYDAALRARILDTPGVAALVDYASTLDRSTRQLRVAATISTIYGNATISQTVNT
jgi:hypothetical protein